MHAHTQSVEVVVTFSPRLERQCVIDEALRLAREELLRGVEKNARLERERAEKQEQQQSAVNQSIVLYLH